MLYHLTGSFDFSNLSTEEQLVDWQNFYQNFFGIELPIISIPERKQDFLLVIPQGMTATQIYAGAEKLLPYFRSTQSLEFVESAISKRSPQEQGYALWVGNSTQTQGGSASLGTTLVEELLYQMMYFARMGKCDQHRITCLATTAGQPPGVFTVGPEWPRGGLIIRWQKLWKNVTYIYRETS